MTIMHRAGRAGEASRGKLRKGIAFALIYSAFLLFAIARARADGGGPKSGVASADSGLEASVEIAFKDIDESDSALDWGPDSGGPEFGIEAWSRIRFRVPGLPWLSLGPGAEAKASVDGDVVTPDEGNPYIVAADMDLRGLAGFGGELALAMGPGELLGDLSLLAGLGVLDLDEADVDYLPAAAAAENFWFRIEPCLGFDLDLSYAASSIEAEVRNRYLVTWDSGVAYDRDWTQGFEEHFDLKVSMSIHDGKVFDAKLKAMGDYSLESRLVVPVMKYGCALRCDLKGKGLGTIKVSPLAWSYRADVPDLDIVNREDIERQLSGKIEWESPLSSGSWSLSLSFPWWADDDAASCPGRWELGLSRKLGD